MTRDLTYNTADSLKEQTSISKNVDVNSLLPYLQSGELMHCLPILGTALDSDLKTQIENNTLTGHNYTLVYEYIIPVSSYSAWYDASTFMHVKTTNKGLVHQFSDSSATVDFATLKLYRQSIKDKLVFFEERLKQYLIDNASTYPLFRSDDCDTNHQDYSNGIFLY